MILLSVCTCLRTRQNRLSGASWGRPGTVWESSGTILGAFLGPSWGHSRPSCGRPGAVLTRLGSSWGRLGLSWGRLGLSWGRPKAVLGLSVAVLAPSWLVLGLSWGRLGLSWGRLGQSWGRLGFVLGRLGAVLGRPGAVRGRPGLHPGGSEALQRPPQDPQRPYHRALRQNSSTVTTEVCDKPARHHGTTGLGLSHDGDGRELHPHPTPHLPQNKANYKAVINNNAFIFVNEDSKRNDEFY